MQPTVSPPANGAPNDNEGSTDQLFQPPQQPTADNPEFGAFTMTWFNAAEEITAYEEGRAHERRRLLYAVGGVSLVAIAIAVTLLVW